MHTLQLAIDQGYTKTALAVADGSGTLLFSRTETDSYAGLTGREDKDRRAGRYRERLSALVTAAAPYLRDQTADITYAGNIAPDETAIRDVLAGAGCTAGSILPSGDALGHYGLSSMPARAFVIGAGSGSIVAYADAQHNLICPAEPHWEVANSGNLLCAGGLSNALLDIYAEEQLSGQPTAISTAIEQHLGRRAPNHSVYHYLYKFRFMISRGRRLELATLIPALVHEPAVAALLDRAAADAVSYLRLLREYFHDPAPQALVLGGSVGAGIPGLDEIFRRHLPFMAVETARGHPAEGVLRYRHAHPQARCDVQFGYDYFSNWTRA